MNVVTAMAVNTCTWCGLNDLDRLCMAAVTVDVGVFTIEFKLRLGIVIEPPDLPAVGRMATIAVQSQFAVMGVIFLVAGITFD